MREMSEESQVVRVVVEATAALVVFIGTIAVLLLPVISALQS